MDNLGQAGDPESGPSAVVPRSHRRPGPASAKLPPQTLGKVFWENPREPITVALVVMLGFGWGVSTLVSDTSAAHRGLGLIAAVAGLLVLVSYVLHFIPTALTSDRWSKTRPRRALRLVLSYSWAVFLVAVVLAGLVGLIFN